MKIVNQTKKTIIAENVVEAKTLWTKSKGLLGTKKPTSLVLQTRWGIHTFGMRYPIDIMILDQKNIVKRIKENLSPNNIFIWNPMHYIVVELPSGWIKKTKTQIGDQITFS